ncbi:MAG: N-6 DNA methylase [archaeon]
MSVSKVNSIYNSYFSSTTSIARNSEEDLRIKLNGAIERSLKAFGEQFTIRAEYKRIDLLVSCKRLVAFELKRYKTFTSGNLEDFKEQIKDYMIKNAVPFGILTDFNDVFAFELKEDDTVDLIESFNFDSSGFLKIINDYLRGQPIKYIGEASLLLDFSGNSPISKKIKRELVKVFNKAKKIPKVNLMFDEWSKLFKLSESTNKRYVQERRNALSVAIGIKVDERNEYEALYILHTALSIILKTLMYALLSNTKKITSTINDIFNLFSKIESGKAFLDLGILNFCNNDFFSWYLYANWDQSWASVLEELKELAFCYRKVIDMNVTDVIQKLYEEFIPREVRHSFGEYFTPYFIAEYMVEKAEERIKKHEYRAIDPTCGSGTFILAVLKSKLDKYNNLSNKEKIDKIIFEVVGIDLNPIAVLMSKFNYLNAIMPLLLSYPELIEIPIYVGDSSYTPAKENVDGIECLKYQYYFPEDSIVKMPEIIFPLDFVRRKDFLKILIDIEDKMNKNESLDEILKTLFKYDEIERASSGVKDKIKSLIKQVYEYHKENLNMIWLYIFMNYLKPFAYKEFDLVIGNPPWVRWSNLPIAYKEKIKNTARRDNLFSSDTNYGGVDLNICALITYRAIENFMVDDGILFFILPSGILKNKSFEGFRKFKLQDKKVDIVAIYIPSKPFFKGEEPVILMLKANTIANLLSQKINRSTFRASSDKQGIFIKLRK